MSDSHMESMAENELRRRDRPPRYEDCKEYYVDDLMSSAPDWMMREALYYLSADGWCATDALLCQPRDVQNVVAGVLLDVRQREAGPGFDVFADMCCSIGWDLG